MAELGAIQLITKSYSIGQLVAISKNQSEIELITRCMTMRQLLISIIAVIRHNVSPYMRDCAPTQPDNVKKAT